MEVSRGFLSLFITRMSLVLRQIVKRLINILTLYSKRRLRKPSTITKMSSVLRNFVLFVYIYTGEGILITLLSPKCRQFHNIPSSVRIFCQENNFILPNYHQNVVVSSSNTVSFLCLSITQEKISDKSVFIF